MFSAQPCGIAMFVCCVMSACRFVTVADAPETAPSIRAVRDAAGRIVAIEAGPLATDALARLSKGADSENALSQLLTVSMDDDAVSKIAIAGSYAVNNETLRFTPRFAFREGQNYRAVLYWPRRESPSKREVADVIYQFRQSASASSPQTEVSDIFPAVAIVPENLLRFYIQFSASMSRGSVYEHVRLLDTTNRPVELPFLELGEELWDAEQKRLTLLIDPGRIKRGVKPREDLGTVLRAGESFTLVVKSSWLDAQNRPLRKQFSKQFRVGPPIEQAIDPTQWQISVPLDDSRQPLTIDFPRPLDHALLERTITVRSTSGIQIEGEVLVSRGQQRWEFRPNGPWRPGKFEIVVDRALEDLAGNRIGRAFELNEVGPISDEIQVDDVRLKFEIPARD
jgi:hypothetical protein